MTRTERRSGDRLIVAGRADGDFHDLIGFFTDSLPEAGLRQEHTEVDPADAESDFEGDLGSGRWQVRNAGDCPGRTDVTVLFVPDA